MQATGAARSYAGVYVPVQRRRHHAFLEEAVERGGGRVLSSTGPGKAPLFLGVEGPGGERFGLCAYVLLANRRAYADGTPKVETQKTRASKGDPSSRLYDPAQFDVLAACLYGPWRRWEFRYRRSDRLERDATHPDRIAAIQRVDGSWAATLAEALAG